MCLLFFFFKQKTAYEMRISDWSSDVCSSDLTGTLDQVELTVTEIAKLESPTALAVRPGSPDLYIADKGGTVRHIEVTEAEESRPARYELQRTPVLDLSDEVINDGEQGLLGLAFSSDGGRFYVDFTAAPAGRPARPESELATRVDLDADTPPPPPK